MRSVISGSFLCWPATFIATDVSNAAIKKKKKWIETLESSDHGLHPQFCSDTCAALSLTTLGFLQVNPHFSFTFIPNSNLNGSLYFQKPICMNLVHHTESEFRIFSLIILYPSSPPPISILKKVCILKVIYIRFLNSLFSLS